MAESGSFKPEFGQPWAEAETLLLQQQILEAFPSGLYRGEPLLLWERIVQKLAKARIGPKYYLADECRKHYFECIEPRIRHLHQRWEVVERPWSERESDTLRSFIHHTLPGVLYKTGLMIWNEIGEKMTEAALHLWLPFRMYTDNCLREHYFRHIRTHFVGTSGARIPGAVLAARTFLDPPWSDVEHDLLRMNIHFTLPGGLLNAPIQLWPEISRKVMTGAHYFGIPYRFYTEDNVRAQYFKYIRPRYVWTSATTKFNVDMKDENPPTAVDAYIKEKVSSKASGSYLRDEDSPRPSDVSMKEEDTPNIKYRC